MRTVRALAGFIIAVFLVFVGVGLFLYVNNLKNEEMKINVIGTGSLSSTGCVPVNVNAMAKAEAYSFDGGKTWQKNNYSTYYQNGEYEVLAKNSKNEIIAQETIVINTIVDGSPKITLDFDKKISSANSIFDGVKAMSSGVDLTPQMNVKITDETKDYVVVTYSVKDDSGRTCLLVSKLDKETK